ncbi:MAG: branched-chain amino acid ABC transporter permease [Anaerolineae bacterium]
MVETLVQNIVFGLLLGALYGLAAVGLSLVFGVTKFLNVAHGELLMLGGYASFWLFSLYRVDPFLSLPLAALALVVVGVVLYLLLFSRTIKMDEEQKVQTTMLIGFGVSVILQNLAQRLWTADDRSITTAYSRMSWTIFDIRFPIVRVVSMVVALVLVIILHQFLQRSYFGKAIRATVEDWEEATIIGIDTHRVYLVAFVIGAAFAGVAGTLVSVGYSIVPSMGLEWTLVCLVVMTLGGLGSIIGTFIGGLILGVAQALTAFAVGGAYRQVVGLLLFLLVLAVRPQGLFGVKEG